jgi:hypothetical protein
VGKEKVPTGSYLVVLNTNGSALDANSSGVCANKSFTLLSPGVDGGLTLGSFQPNPDPTFGPNRNSRANLIVAPVMFDGYRLGMATTARDEQNSPTGPPIYPPPTGTVSGNHLYVSLPGLDMTWRGLPNRTCANSVPPGFGCNDQGSRKASGTIDLAKNTYSLSWFSSSAFNGGTAVEVYITGQFVGHVGAKVANG